MDVVITLKLSASEFQTLRQELTDTQNRLREEQKKLKDQRHIGARDEARALLHREGAVTFLLEKLG